MKKITHKQYVDWIKSNRPDYEVLEKYVNTSTKILHRHKESGIQWKCSPDKFKNGISPPALSRNNNSPIKITHEQYVDWIKLNRPDYEVLEKYVNTKYKLLHRHKESGIQWKCSPEKFKRGHSPTELTKCERWDHNKYCDFITKNKIPIKVIDQFKNQKISIKHQCLNTNNIFYISPIQVIKAENFSYKDIIRDTESYKKWLSKYRPELVITEPYINSRTKINHLHVITGDCWRVRPNNVQQGQQHPCEHLTGVSIKSLKWLTHIEQTESKYIQHYGHGSEYNIPTIGKVDGYCKNTNTVYEFHGDFWHGNPKIFNANDTNPVNNELFEDLYNNTIKRDNNIKKLGFNLIVIWEDDYNKDFLK